LALVTDPDTTIQSAAAIAYREAVNSFQAIERYQVNVHESHLRQQHALLDASLALVQISADTDLGLQIDSREGLSLLGSSNSRASNSRMETNAALNNPPPAKSTRSQTDLSDKPISALTDQVTDTKTKAAKAAQKTSSNADITSKKTTAKKPTVQTETVTNEPPKDTTFMKHISVVVDDVTNRVPLPNVLQTKHSDTDQHVTSGRPKITSVNPQKPVENVDVPKKDVAMHETDVAAHKQDVAAHKQDVASHKQDVVAHEQDVATYKQDVAAANKNVGTK
jgi:hypothetical protein